jgi:DNA-binding FadR family transcriptional regulator
MAKSLRVRLAEYRRRQKAAGMVRITLLVPKADTRLYRDMAFAARHKKRTNFANRPAVGIAPERPMPASQIRLARRWQAASGLKLQVDQPGLKLGGVLARCITQEILRAKWPVGRNLGSEHELKLRYGVGRNALRDAIRVLEYQSVARMRRGPSGGLIVVQPDLESTAYLAGLYLEFRGIAKSNLLRMRREIQFVLLERCMDNLDDAGKQTLRAVIDEEQKYKGRTAPAIQVQRFHMILAQLTGDPALELFTDLVLRLTRNHVRLHLQPHEPTVLRRTLLLHRAIAHAMIEGDRVKAREFMNEHLNLIKERMV